VPAKEATRGGTPVSRQSMPAFLSAVEDAAGQLVTISQEVRLDYEVAACPSESAAALRFESTRGDVGPTKMQVVGDLLNSLPRFAVGISSTTNAIQTKLLAATEKPLSPRVMATAPCQEEMIDDPSLADELPIPRFFGKECGPYVTAGTLIATMAVEEINVAGGVLGQKIELVAYDDKAKSDHAIFTANKVIGEDGVKLLLDGSYSSAGRAAAAVFQKVGVVMISAYGGRRNHRSRRLCAAGEIGGNSSGRRTPSAVSGPRIDRCTTSIWP
jgi:hypothetical protein